MRIRFVKRNHSPRAQQTPSVVLFGINVLVAWEGRKSVLVRYVSALAVVVHGLCQGEKGFYQESGDYYAEKPWQREQSLDLVFS